MDSTVSVEQIVPAKFAHMSSAAAARIDEDPAFTNYDMLIISIQESPWSNENDEVQVYHQPGAVNEIIRRMAEKQSLGYKENAQAFVHLNRLEIIAEFKARKLFDVAAELAHGEPTGPHPLSEKDFHDKAYAAFPATSLRGTTLEWRLEQIEEYMKATPVPEQPPKVALSNRAETSFFRAASGALRYLAAREDGLALIFPTEIELQNFIKNPGENYLNEVKKPETRTKIIGAVKNFVKKNSKLFPQVYKELQRSDAPAREK